MLWLLACAPRVVEPEVSVHRSPGGLAELLSSGPAEARVSTEAADLVLFYAGELKGNPETCGCLDNPRGGLARMGTYLDASRRLDPTPSLLLVSGYWLMNARREGSANPEILQVNGEIQTGLEALGTDAANLSYHDVGGLQSPPEWAVSANVEGPGVAAVRTLQVDGVRVAVVGIGRPGPNRAPAPGYLVHDPYERGLAALQSVDAQVLVLLAWNSPEVARDLVQAVPAIDVVVDANAHQGFFEPFTVGDTLWVRAHDQNMRLGELRLRVGDDRVELVRDRKIDLDADLD